MLRCLICLMVFLPPAAALGQSQERTSYLFDTSAIEHAGFLELLERGLSGTVVQSGSDGYEVAITVTPEGVSVEYEGLCSGGLDFLRFEGQTLVFEESIRDGRASCVDGGTVRLETQDREHVSYAWAGSGMTAAGELDVAPSKLATETSPVPSVAGGARKAKMPHKAESTPQSAGGESAAGLAPGGAQVAAEDTSPGAPGGEAEPELPAAPTSMAAVEGDPRVAVCADAAGDPWEEVNLGTGGGLANPEEILIYENWSAFTDSCIALRKLHGEALPAPLRYQHGRGYYGLNLPRLPKSAPAHLCRRASFKDDFDQAARAGYPPALYSLALLHREGYCAEHDPERARELMARAAAGGFAPAQLEIARMAVSEGAPLDEEVIATLTKAAEQGHPEAQLLLGEIYLGHHEAPADHGRAQHWLTEAAGSGSAEAQVLLSTLDTPSADDLAEFEDRIARAAELLENATGPTKIAEAAALLQPAAEAGLADAQFALGVLELGEHVPLDDGAEASDDRKLLWLRAAALQDHLPAQAFLGRALWEREKPSGMENFRRGLIEEAVRWLRPPAEAGVILAQDTLARALETLGRDDEALPWFRRAAEAGWVPAQLAAGLRLWRMKTYEEAVPLLRAAADADQPRALATLGYAYANGYGVEQDDARAVAYWREAAQRGDALGAERLAAAYRDGRGGLRQDHSEALRWNRRAAELGSETAARELQGSAMQRAQEQERALGMAAAIVVLMIATGGHDDVGGGASCNPALQGIGAASAAGMNTAAVYVPPAC